MARVAVEGRRREVEGEMGEMGTVTIIFPGGRSRRMKEL